MVQLAGRGFSCSERDTTRPGLGTEPWTGLWDSGLDHGLDSGLNNGSIIAYRQGSKVTQRRSYDLGAVNLKDSSSELYRRDNHFR